MGETEPAGPPGPALQDSHGNRSFFNISGPAGRGIPEDCVQDKDDRRLFCSLIVTNALCYLVIKNKQEGYCIRFLAVDSDITHVAQALWWAWPQLGPAPRGVTLFRAFLGSLGAGACLRPPYLLRLPMFHRRWLAPSSLCMAGLTPKTCHVI